MSSSWDVVERKQARVDACPGHTFEQVSRAEQERARDFRPWRCSECLGLFENIEKRAYEQGFERGKASAPAPEPAGCWHCGVALLPDDEPPHCNECPSVCDGCPKCRRAVTEGRVVAATDVDETGRHFALDVPVQLAGTVQPSRPAAGPFDSSEDP